ncbi:hypothetical protein CAL30_00195 [Megasphaera hutchinsoni]|jgi:hypothetical protein|uniref:Phosphagen kinase C-terminal domain-containing protein n=2 Tax=Megasphaera hutchinsoni TaxID=1588748 RepID=A0A2J8BCC2_9FIRM|nr:hypothetical protein CAL30_00195 [Megasphaera genomosp. type_2]
MGNQRFQDMFTSWQEHTQAAYDVVLESRVHIHRNIRSYAFPLVATAEVLAKVYQDIKQALYLARETEFYCLQWIDIDSLTAKEKEWFVSWHWITAEMTNRKHTGLAISADGALQLQLNGTDHIQINTACTGFSLKPLWQRANACDDALEAVLPVAFHRKLGYITASPALLGTGLKINILLHLPGIVQQQRLRYLIPFITNEGFLLQRDVTPETHIFQLTNQVTLGVTEQDIMERIFKVVQRIVNEERQCRLQYIEENQAAFIDMGKRAYAILSYAYMLNRLECMRLWSQLRWAVASRYIDLPLIACDQLFFAARDADIADVMMKNKCTSIEINRAAFVQKALEKYKV